MDNASQDDQAPKESNTNLDVEPVESTAVANESSETETTETPATETPDTPVATDTPVHPPVFGGEPQKSRKPLIISLIVLLVVAAGGGAAALISNHHASKQSTIATKTAPKVTPKVVPSAHFEATFLDQPVAEIPTPKFFSNYAQFENSECGTSSQTKDSFCPDYQLTYNKIGTTKAGQDIILFDNGEGGEAHQDYVALKNGPNKYVILGKFSYITNNNAGGSAQSIADFKAQLDPSTSLDMDSDLPDLRFNLKVTAKQASFDTYQYNSSALPYGYPIKGGITGIRGSSYDPLETSAVSKIGMDGPKTIYEARVRNAANYALQTVYATVNQVYALGYQLVDDMAHYSADGSSSNPPTITWSDGTTTKDFYTYNAQGCGAPGAYITAKNITASALTKVGTSPSGRPLYTLPTNSPLFQEIYNDDYGSGTDLSDTSKQNLTAAQLQDRHVVVVAQNGMGEWVVYKDSEYFMGGGCAKPVVYLYPAKTEQVNVSVGAKVTKSIPSYGTYGWNNVTAQPNGQLTYQGANYDSLFWEGTGLGSYPIVDAGTIVSSNTAVSTIRSQLAAQGLKPSEINDFVTYWAPKLPQTKYVRLTWFNTAELNGLAPLHVSPAPTTVIRTFLDFQGLNRTYPLKAQHFSAPARTGFTVVEWGGLNRSN